MTTELKMGEILLSFHNPTFPLQIETYVIKIYETDYKLYSLNSLISQP